MYKHILIFTRAIACLLLFLLSCSESSGQIVNGGFQTLTCATNNGYLLNAFNNNCVSDWKTSHGSPDIYDYFNSKYTNSNHAYLTFQEGIFTNYSMEEAHVYTLSLETAVSLDGAGITPEPQQVNIFVVAANNLSSSNGAKPSPSKSQVMAVIPHTFGEDMKTSKVYNIIPNGNYNQLWIYWEYAIDGVRHSVYLDNISITPNCPLRKTLYYQNTSLMGAATYEGVIIKAGSSVNSNLANGPVQVVVNSNTTFISDHYVALENQFDVSVGANFTASITTQNPCLISSGRRSASSIEEEQVQTENLKQAIQVIPNPTAGLVSLVSQHMERNGSFTIIDAMGKEVYAQKLEREIMSLDLSHLISGIYTIKAYADGKVCYNKIVIQH